MIDPKINLDLKFTHCNDTGEFRRLGRCFIDWATAVAGEADRELTCVNFTYHGSGPIYETSDQSTKFTGTGSYKGFLVSFYKSHRHFAPCGTVQALLFNKSNDASSGVGDPIPSGRPC